MRELTVKREKGQVTLEVTGNANVASTTIEQLDIFGILSNTSIVSSAYDFTCDYDFTSAKVTFKLDKAKIDKLGYSYDDLTVLNFNPLPCSIKKSNRPSTRKNGTITAELKHFSTYVVGVEKTVNDEATTRIAFLVDNSGSMYPKELCPPSSENDIDFKRLDFASSLINKIEGKYKFSISKFTGDYTKLQGFTDDRKKLKDALDSIKNETEIFTGTHSQSALESCMNEFTNDSYGKYRNIIVMLTDGESDENNPKSIEQLAQIAKEKKYNCINGRTWTRGRQKLASGICLRYRRKILFCVRRQRFRGRLQADSTTLNYDIVSYSNSSDTVNGLLLLYNTGFDPETTALL